MNLNVGDVFVSVKASGEVSEICRVTAPGKAWVLNGHWNASFSETALTGVQGEPEKDFECPIIWRGTPPAEVAERGEGPIMRWINEQLAAFEPSFAP